jgi:hypothetical protein
MRLDGVAKEELVKHWDPEIGGVFPKATAPEPTIEDRKAIAMQAMSDASMVDHAAAPGAVELCGKEWPNRDTGQWGRCGLTQGHRGNCGRFIVFDKVD